MKLWLKKNDIEMYQAHNERKSVFTERGMTSVSKNVFIDKVDDIVNK